MKDSGVEWIGEIPEDWEVVRIKNLTTGVMGGIWGSEAQGDTNDISCVRIADFDRRNFKFRDIDFTIRSLDINKQKQYLLKSGDLLIEKSGGGEKQPVGFVVMYDFNSPVIYTNFMAKIGVNHNLADSNFLKYMFASLYYNNINLKSIKQTTGIQNLDTDSYLNEFIVIPSLSQQKAIANFLDEKTQEIDNIISKTKKAIEEYKKYKQSLITETVTKGLDENVEMKDSGIEWIGDTPKHWDVIRLKYLGWTRSGLGNKSTSDFGHGYPFITYKNIYENYELKSHYISDLVDSTDNERKLFNALEGDVFFTGSSETVEELGLSSVCMENIVDSTFNGFSIRFRPKKDVLCKGFSKFYFRSCAVREFLIRYDNSITRANLSQRLLKGMEILLPPLDEQKSIANYLDNKCSQIDQIISTKEKLLIEMEAYKKSLIYETVTGKREVE